MIATGVGSSAKHDAMKGLDVQCHHMMVRHRGLFVAHWVDSFSKCHPSARLHSELPRYFPSAVKSFLMILGVIQGT